FVGTGDRAMIAGFVVAPQGPLTLLLRAIGPGLAGAPFNLTGVLRDPVMEVYGPDGAGGSRLLFTIDDWADTDPTFTAAIASEVAAFPLASGSRDAAVVATLAPGAYTLVVHSAAGAGDTGLGLVEIYTVP